MCVLSHLVLQGHDGVVLAGVDVQDVVVVPAAQVVGEVGEGGAGCFGHSVVDDHEVILDVLTRVPHSLLSATFLDVTHFQPCDGTFYRDRSDRLAT